MAPTSSALATLALTIALLCGLFGIMVFASPFPAGVDPSTTFSWSCERNKFRECEAVDAVCDTTDDPERCSEVRGHFRELSCFSRRGATYLPVPTSLCSIVPEPVPRCVHPLCEYRCALPSAAGNTSAYISCDSTATWDCPNSDGCSYTCKRERSVACFDGPSNEWVSDSFCPSSRPAEIASYTSVPTAGALCAATIGLIYGTYDMSLDTLTVSWTGLTVTPGSLSAVLEFSPGTQPHFTADYRASIRGAGSNEAEGAPVLAPDGSLQFFFSHPPTSSNTAVYSKVGSLVLPSLYNDFNPISGKVAVRLKTPAGVFASINIPIRRFRSVSVPQRTRFRFLRSAEDSAPHVEYRVSFPSSRESLSTLLASVSSVTLSFVSTKSKSSLTAVDLSKMTCFFVTPDLYPLTQATVLKSASRGPASTHHHSFVASPNHLVSSDSQSVSVICSGLVVPYGIAGLTLLIDGHAHDNTRLTVFASNMEWTVTSRPQLMTLEVKTTGMTDEELQSPIDVSHFADLGDTFPAPTLIMPLAKNLSETPVVWAYRSFLLVLPPILAPLLHAVDSKNYNSHINNLNARNQKWKYRNELQIHVKNAESCQSNFPGVANDLMPCEFACGPITARCVDSSFPGGYNPDHRHCRNIDPESGSHPNDGRVCSVIVKSASVEVSFPNLISRKYAKVDYRVTISGRSAHGKLIVADMSLVAASLGGTPQLHDCSDDEPSQVIQAPPCYIPKRDIVRFIFSVPTSMDLSYNGSFAVISNGAIKPHPDPLAITLKAGAAFMSIFHTIPFQFTPVVEDVQPTGSISLVKGDYGNGVTPTLLTIDCSARGSCFDSEQASSIVSVRFRSHIFEPIAQWPNTRVVALFGMSVEASPMWPFAAGPALKEMRIDAGLRAGPDDQVLFTLPATSLAASTTKAISLFFTPIFNSRTEREVFNVWIDSGAGTSVRISGFPALTLIPPSKQAPYLDDNSASAFISIRSAKRTDFVSLIDVPSLSAAVGSSFQVHQYPDRITLEHRFAPEDRMLLSLAPNLAISLRTYLQRQSPNSHFDVDTELTLTSQRYCGCWNKSSSEFTSCTQHMSACGLSAKSIPSIALRRLSTDGTFVHECTSNDALDANISIPAMCHESAIIMKPYLVFLPLSNSILFRPNFTFPSGSLHQHLSAQVFNITSVPLSYDLTEEMCMANGFTIHCYLIPTSFGGKILSIEVPGWAFNSEIVIPFAGDSLEMFSSAILTVWYRSALSHPTTLDILHKSAVPAEKGTMIITETSMDTVAIRFSVNVTLQTQPSDAFYHASALSLTLPPAIAFSMTSHGADECFVVFATRNGTDGISTKITADNLRLFGVRMFFAWGSSTIDIPVTDSTSTLVHVVCLGITKTTGINEMATKSDTGSGKITLVIFTEATSNTTLAMSTHVTSIVYQKHSIPYLRKYVLTFSSPMPIQEIDQSRLEHANSKTDHVIHIAAEEEEPGSASGVALYIRPGFPSEVVESSAKLLVRLVASALKMKEGDFSKNMMISVPTPLCSILSPDGNQHFDQCPPISACATSSVTAVCVSPNTNTVTDDEQCSSLPAFSFFDEHDSWRRAGDGCFFNFKLVRSALKESDDGSYSCSFSLTSSTVPPAPPPLVARIVADGFFGLRTHSETFFLSDLGSGLKKAVVAPRDFLPQSTTGEVTCELSIAGKTLLSSTAVVPNRLVHSADVAFTLADLTPQSSLTFEPSKTDDRFLLLSIASPESSFSSFPLDFKGTLNFTVFFSSRVDVDFCYVVPHSQGVLPDLATAFMSSKPAFMSSTYLDSDDGSQPTMIHFTTTMKSSRHGVALACNSVSFSDDIEDRALSALVSFTTNFGTTFFYPTISGRKAHGYVVDVFSFHTSQSNALFPQRALEDYGQKLRAKKFHVEHSPSTGGGTAVISRIGSFMAHSDVRHRAQILQKLVRRDGSLFALESSIMALSFAFPVVICVDTNGIEAACIPSNNTSCGANPTLNEKLCVNELDHSDLYPMEACATDDPFPKITAECGQSLCQTRKDTDPVPCSHASVCSPGCSIHSSVRFDETSVSKPGYNRYCFKDGVVVDPDMYCPLHIIPSSPYETICLPTSSCIFFPLTSDGRRTLESHSNSWSKCSSPPGIVGQAKRTIVCGSDSETRVGSVPAQVLPNEFCWQNPFEGPLVRNCLIPPSVPSNASNPFTTLVILTIAIGGGVLVVTIIVLALSAFFKWFCFRRTPSPSRDPVPHQEDSDSESFSYSDTSPEWLVA